MIFGCQTMPMWRNWQTHLTQNQAVNNRAGSSPAIGSVVRTADGESSEEKSSELFLSNVISIINLTVINLFGELSAHPLRLHRSTASDCHWLCYVFSSVYIIVYGIRFNSCIKIVKSPDLVYSNERYTKSGGIR